MTRKQFSVLMVSIAVTLLLITGYWHIQPDYIYEDNPVWLDQLKIYEGLAETEGPENNQWIVGSYRLCKLDPSLWDDNKTSWCTSGFNKILAEVRIKGTGSAIAESFKTWGAPVGIKAGAVCVFRQGSGYHVTVMVSGEVVKRNGVEYYACIGCNQSDQIKISYYKVSDLVAIRWPTEKERILE